MVNPRTFTLCWYRPNPTNAPVVVPFPVRTVPGPPRIASPLLGMMGVTTWYVPLNRQKVVPVPCAAMACWMWLLGVRRTPWQDPPRVMTVMLADLPEHPAPLQATAAYVYAVNAETPLSVNDGCVMPLARTL